MTEGRHTKYCEEKSKEDFWWILVIVRVYQLMFDTFYHVD
jgi:hypothetical protein